MKTNETTTKNNNEKSLIIAERIKLPFISNIVCFVIILIVFAGLLTSSIIAEITFLTILWLILIIAISIYFIFDIKEVITNNKLDAVIISYKNNFFKIHDPVESLKINKKNIIDLDYKNKTSYIYTKYYIGSTTYNYGKLYIYYKKNNEEYKLTLKNVANPDKVFEKMCDILGLNYIDDED